MPVWYISGMCVEQGRHTYKSLRGGKDDSSEVDTGDQRGLPSNVFSKHLCDFNAFGVVVEVGIRCCRHAVESEFSILVKTGRSSGSIEEFQARMVGLFGSSPA